MKVCEICGRIAYYDCAECGRTLCDSHVEKCSKCERWFCSKHIKFVGGKHVCRKCLSSRVILYAGVSAVIIFVVIGMAFAIPRILDRLMVTGGDLEFNPDQDGQNVVMGLTLTYRNKSGSTLEIVNVSFDDEIIQKSFRMEFLENRQIEKNQSGELTILFQNISYEEAKDINRGVGTVYWKKSYMGRQESTKFSFKIGEIPEYPVIVGEIRLSSEEIKVRDPFAVEIVVEVLENMPEESRPLTLEMKIADENIVRPAESSTGGKLLEIGRKDYRFDFMAHLEGTTTITFRVVAKDGVVWADEKNLSVLVGKHDTVKLSGVRLTDENGNPLESNVSGEYLMYFSKEGQRYRHRLTFVIEGRGTEIIVLVYFDVPYSEFSGITVIEPTTMRKYSMKGQFEGHVHGLFFIIPNLEGKIEFQLVFDNPTFKELGGSGETLGVALVKIGDEKSSMHDMIEQSTNRTISSSRYDLNCPQEIGDGYQYCFKEFAIKFEKEPESPEPSPTGTETERPGLSGGSPKSILLFYASFLTFLLTYISLRRGGML